MVIEIAQGEARPTVCESLIGLTVELTYFESIAPYCANPVEVRAVIEDRLVVGEAGEPPNSSYYVPFDVIQKVLVP